ncbi:P-loop containing nucleoside triphosphate hydrolase protein, partial [Paraphysoderma sedebokerense]
MYYVKWKGLKYEESTWDYLPDTDAQDFKVAFAEWERAQEIDSLKTYKQRLKKLGRNGNPDNEKKVLLKNFDEFTEQPEILQNGTLRPHQLDGLNWLYYNWWKNIPCILADEMGLGKTIQTVSLLSVLHHNFQQFPFLVVAPNSTLDNWVREFNKWAPQLRVVMFSGGAKDRELIRDYEIFRPKSNTDAGGAKGLRCHVVIASYEMVWMDSCLKSVHHWDVLIVDEGHRLKNDASKLFDSLQQMNIKHRVLLTGTPLQNNVRELFNIMHFLDPLKFQNPEELASQYEDLDRDKLGELHEQLKPHFLRRVKSQVLRDLPPKAEIIVPVTMSPIQKGIYKDIISANCELLKALGGSSSTKSKQKNTSLQNIFLQLRKCLSHPYLIPGVEQDLKSAEEVKKRLIDSSGKLTLLHSMLPKLKARGHKVLIFSQFLETLDILEDYLTAEGYGYYRLDGSTSRVERQEKIDAFNAPKSEAFVFILSTRAGGVGVNLTSADTVIIYDVDWNPHQDLQAISRAHRIGQTRKVLAYKLMTRGSAEERMVQIGRKKLVLDHLIVQQMEKAELDEKDFESILKYGAQTLFEESDEKAQEFQKYDEAAIEALLDRSQAVEEPEQPEEADAAADAFGFEKVWKNDDMENLTVETEDKEKEMEGDENFWDNLVQQSLMKAKSQREEELGRGARRKARDVQYNFDMSSPPKTKKSKKDISRGASAENSDEDDVDQEYMPKVDDDSDDDDFIDGLARDEMDLESRNRRMLFDPLSRTEPYPENYQLTYSAASRPHLTEEVRDLLKESLQKLHSALEGMKSSATTLAAAFPKRSALGTVTQKYHCWLCNGTVYQKTDRHSAADCDILKMPDVLSERRRNFYARKEIDKVSWIDRQSLGPHHAANAVDIRQSILSNTSQNPSKPIYLKPNVNQHPSFNSANSKYGMANERQSPPSSRIIAGQSGCLVCRSVPFHPPSNCPLRHKPRELLARRREILRNPRSDPNETIFATLDFFLQQFGLYTQDDLDEHTLSNVDYGTYCPGCDNFGHFIHNCETRFHPGELRDSYETVKNTRRIPKYVKKELLAVLADYIRNPPP